MTYLVAAAFSAVVAFSALGGPASAGSCGGQIAQFEQTLAQDPHAVGTAPQTVDAQLEHQPTPASIAQAKANARGNVASALDEAKALDAQGRDAECMAALERARLLLHP